MEPNSSLGQAVAILKTISNVSWEESRIYGSIQVTPSLKTFAEDYYDTFEIELEDETGSLIDLSKIDSYSHLQIKFLPPRTNRSFLAKDFDDLLTHFNFHLTLCDEFYIHDQDIYFPDSNCTNKQLKAYQKIIELLKTLDLVSDHTQQKPTYCQILLTSKEKIFIPVSYSKTDIENTPESLVDFDLEQFRIDLTSAPHKKSKLLLFKKAIIQFILNETDSAKLSTIIVRFNDVLRSYQNNYDLFLSEFSFEDEKEKLEVSKQEYLNKLNNVLSGIHGKLLAVPASLVIIASQMKSDQNSAQLLNNATILAGAYIFSALMLLLTANQLHSLRAIQNEYEAREQRFRNDLSASLYSELSRAFTQLKKRFKFQRIVILGVDLLITLSAIASFVIFEYHTKFLYNIL